MTRKVVLIAISKNVVWKETARQLKLYRMKYIWDLDKYNIVACKLIEFYRKIEFEIETEWKRYTKFQYRDMIENLKLEKGI